MKKKQGIISETSINDKKALPIGFAYSDGKNTSFATAYFEADLSGILYCVFMD